MIKKKKKIALEITVFKTISRHFITPLPIKIMHVSSCLSPTLLGA